MRNVTIFQALGDKLLDQLVDLASNVPIVSLVDAIEHQITAPNIEEINKRLGQENDPRYLAYAIVAAFEEAGVKKVERWVN